MSDDPDLPYSLSSATSTVLAEFVLWQLQNNLHQHTQKAHSESKEPDPHSRNLIPFKSLTTLCLTYLTLLSQFLAVPEF